MPMRIITIKVPEELLKKIDEEVRRGSFQSRAEFFRYLVTKYFEEKGKHHIVVVGVHDIKYPVKDVSR